ncbi:MAG TPA: hypothetical protein VF595_10365 [Tepidisphaeraceae bacterium]|jgi:hypothetical protein
MDTYTTRIVISLSALAAAALLCGCANDKLPPISANDRFLPDDAPRPVDHIFAQQRANGAREDGTLYPQHFSGGRLNSLGYAKLSAMSQDPSAGKLMVYLDVPKGDAFWAAQDSVMKALARGGYAEDGYTIASGPNPNLGTPAAVGLSGLAKQRGPDGATGPDSGTPGTGTIAK